MPDGSFRTIDDRPIVWTDGGITHLCVGAAIQDEMTVYWTLCDLDVRSGSPHPARGGEHPTCPACLAVATRNDTVDRAVRESGPPPRAP